MKKKSKKKKKQQNILLGAVFPCGFPTSVGKKKVVLFFAFR